MRTMSRWVTAPRAVRISVRADLNTPKASNPAKTRNPNQPLPNRQTAPFRSTGTGPRPPLAGEVLNYDLDHLRRLDVTPGITGLWQVQGRQDPSFASYVSLDVTYIDNWSIWLDFKIILRTIAVVFSGTGT